jgi:hypothetical protein
MSHGYQGETLLYAGALSATAAALHIAIVAGGAKWYRYFGAGERFVKAAEKGYGWHDVVTLGIAAMLAAWAFYAWSWVDNCQVCLLLPFQGNGPNQIILAVITGFYLLRGSIGLALLLTPQRMFGRWFIGISSLICLGIGIVHMRGLLEVWNVQY